MREAVEALTLEEPGAPPGPWREFWQSF